MKLRTTPSHLFFLLMVLFFSLQAIAQSKNYIVHKIKQGETLSGLAKQYHTSVGNIMRVNGMNSKSVLRIGEQVKIPAKKEKPVAKAENKKTTRQAPVQLVVETAANTAIHLVQHKETLYSISKKYKVTVDQIKMWNHLSSSNIHEGQPLIIGANTGQEMISAKEPIASVQPAVKSDPPKQGNVAENNSATVATPAQLPAEKKEEPVANADNIGIEGYFASLYKNGREEMSGDAAPFKTASGWTDKKYYVLINNIPEGTIVRVASNDKIVFAKVLGPLPSIKEDNGLLMRISNAAASALGLADKKFPVIVNY